MMTVFIAYMVFSDESVDVIGVSGLEDSAVRRCREANHLRLSDHPRCACKHFQIEEWELGGSRIGEPRVLTDIELL